MFIFKASGKPQLKARPGIFTSAVPVHVESRERRESWWLRAASVGASRFAPIRALSSFSPPKALPEAGRYLCGRGQVSERRSPGAGVQRPSLGSAGGSVNPPGAEGGVARGSSAGLPAPASRGTATPTGRTGTASGPSGRPWAAGTRWRGLRRPKASAPQARPRPRGLACPLGKAMPPLLENPKGWGGAGWACTLARAHAPSSRRVFLLGNPGGTRRHSWPPSPGFRRHPGEAWSPDLPRGS